MEKLLSCLTSAPSICQNEKHFLRNKFLNVGPKFSYLGIFGLELKKDTELWYFTSAPSNFSRNKKKILKFGTKTALIGYFWLEFQKSNVVFEISILEFVNMLIFMQKQENFKLGSKIPYLGTCGLQFNKNYYQIFNQYPRI